MGQVVKSPKTDYLLPSLWQKLKFLCLATWARLITPESHVHNVKSMFYGMKTV